MREGRGASANSPTLPPNELFQKAHEELGREFPLIRLTLKNLAEGSVTLSRAGVPHTGLLLVRGMDLTGQVEEFLKK